MFLAFGSVRPACRIGLASLLFLLPLALVLYLLIQVQDRDIVFTAREVAGAQALAALSRLQAEACQGLTADGAPGAEAASAATDEAAAFGLLGLPAGEAAGPANADPAALSGRRAALRALIATVADRSNLARDPTPASAGLIDLLLHRLPDLLDRLTDIGGLAAAQRHSVEARTAFRAGIGGLASLLVSMDVAMRAAMDADESATLAVAIGPQYASLHRGLEEFVERLRTTADTSASQGLLDASAAFAQLAGAELDAMLNARLASLRAGQRFTLAVTSLLFALGVTGLMLLLRIGLTRAAIDPWWNATEAARQAPGGGDGHAIGVHALDQEPLEAEARQDYRWVADRHLTVLSAALTRLHGSAAAAGSLPGGVLDEGVMAAHLAEAADTGARAVNSAMGLLAATSTELARTVAQATSAVRLVQRHNEAAPDVVAELTDVAENMAGDLDMIGRIAGQTGLLEPAGAIAPYRGGDDPADLHVGLMHGIVTQVAALEGRARALVVAVGDQRGATRDIGQCLIHATDAVATVSARLAALNTSCSRTRLAAVALLAAMRGITGQVSLLQHEMQRFQAAGRDIADRRSSPRREVELGVHVITRHGAVLDGLTTNVSASGAAIVCAAAVAVGEVVVVRGLSPEDLCAHVVARGGGVIRLQFRRDPQTRAALRELAEWAA